MSVPEGCKKGYMLLGTAKKVGSRHGRPVIYEIDCRQMAADGYHFFESSNHVWLIKEVPVKYLKKEEIN